MVVRINRHPAFQQGSPRIGIVFGGCFQSLARTPESLQCDLYIYVDVLTELRNAWPRKSVLTVSLGSGQTIGTLAESGECDPELRIYLGHHAAVNLNDGLAQLRAVGDLAVKQLIASPEFGAFLRKKVFSPLLIAHNGSIQDLTVVTFASISGGTGGPGVRIVAESIRDLFLERFPATVQLDLFRCGSLTFEGLGERVHTNAAATLAEDVDFVTSPNRHPREVRKLYLIELGMFETDRALRNEHACQLVQAFSSRAVRERYGMHAPNAAYDSLFGGITVMRGEWHESLDPRAIAQEVASNYRSKFVCSAKTPPASNTVQSIQVKLAREGQARERHSVDQLLEMARNAGGIEPTAFRESCLQVSVRQAGRVTASLSQERTLNLTSGSRVFVARPYRSLGNCQQIIGESRGLVSALDVELRQREQQRECNQRLLLTRKAELDRICGRLFPASFLLGVFEWSRQLFTDREDLFARLKSAIEQVRQVAIQIAKLELETKLLLSCRQVLDNELKVQVARLSRAASALQKIESSFRSGREPLIEVADIDEVLEEVLEFTADGAYDEEELVRLLASRVARVTIHGLARIVGSKEDRTASIARHLIEGSTANQGPSWAGAASRSTGQPLFVLPPVADELGEEIAQLVRQFDETVSVVNSEVAAAGVNIVRLEAGTPHHKEDIFTMFTKKNLQAAQGAPALYFPNGMDCVERLGLQASNGHPAMHHPK